MKRFDIPPNVFADAIQFFWQQRERQASSAREGEGERQSVTGGKHLDGVLTAIVSLMTRHGVLETEIFTDCSIHKTGKLELPGYYRPTKKWDLLVVRDNRLLAALELKAQAGPSFGNNINNRSEEALGSSEDLWTAFREGALVNSPQPWLGYLFLLEEHFETTKSKRIKQPHFKVFKAFEKSSYAKRYELLCRRLVLERKYTSACFLMSKNPQSEATSTKEGSDENHSQQALMIPEEELSKGVQVYSEPSPDLGARQFLSSLLRYVVPD